MEVLENKIQEIFSNYELIFFIESDDLSNDILKDLKFIKTLIWREYEILLDDIQKLSYSSNRVVYNGNLLIQKLKNTKIAENISATAIDMYYLILQDQYTSSFNAFKESLNKAYTTLPNIMADKSFIDANNTCKLPDIALQINEERKSILNSRNKISINEKSDTSYEIPDLIKEIEKSITYSNNFKEKIIPTILEELNRTKNIWAETIFIDANNKINSIKNSSNSNLNSEYITIASNVIITSYMMLQWIKNITEEFIITIENYINKVLYSFNGLTSSGIYL